MKAYDYRDRDGRLLFQVCRYEPKAFRQRRPDGQGGNLWNLNATPRVLYRLPELVSADPETLIYVVEGEKDGDRLAGEGLVATTCPQGTGKWSKLSDDSVLDGHPVVLRADNDEDGRKHVQDVARRLHGRAADVRIVELPGLAEFDDAIYLDLEGDEWEYDRVTADGWEIIPAAACPVRFVRRRGMLPIPPPERGGSIDKLRPLVNVPDDDLWLLLKAWLLAALRPSGPYPVLNVEGEQGSAKSSRARIIRALFDPNQAPIRSGPKEVRDLMIAARAGWFLSFDNLSSLRPWLRDALCCLATGGGLATRQLFTDDEEKIFDAMRPIVLNGINGPATRPDLLDRSISLMLPAIPDDCRRSEHEMRADFEAVRSGVLGVLFDAVSAGLRNLKGVHLDGLPRMADFVMWVIACGPALGIDKDEFLAAYAGNRQAGTLMAIDAAPIGLALVALIEAEKEWKGRAGELLEELNTGPWADDRARRHKDWPQTPQKMGGALRELAPELCRIGIETEYCGATGHSNKRLWRFRQVPAESVTSFASVANTPDGTENADSGDSSAIEASHEASHRSHEASHKNGDSSPPAGISMLATLANDATLRVPTSSADAETQTVGPGTGSPDDSWEEA